MSKLQPLDIVETPKGELAYVTDVSTTDRYSISYFKEGNPSGEKNAWWEPNDLNLVSSIPRILTKEFAHPFGNGRHKVDEYFNVKDRM